MALRPALAAACPIGAGFGRTERWRPGGQHSHSFSDQPGTGLTARTASTPGWTTPGLGGRAGCPELLWAPGGTGHALRVGGAGPLPGGERAGNGRHRQVRSGGAGHARLGPPLRRGALSLPARRPASSRVALVLPGGALARGAGCPAREPGAAPEPAAGGTA